MAVPSLVTGESHRVRVQMIAFWVLTSWVTIGFFRNFAGMCFHLKVNELGEEKICRICAKPIPVAAWFNARICGPSLLGIAGSNLAGGIGVCLL